MALDEAGARSLEEGRGFLRFYRWNPATVSFGRNQPARGLYDVGVARAAGVGFVRRPTGGRAVFHHLEVTYGIAFPVGSLGTPREAYHRINRGLAAGLQRLGAAVEVAGEDAGVALPPDAGPCFRAPAPGEITARGRKLVGSAQVRMGGVILQHGSILLDGSQDLLTRLGEEEDPGAVPPLTLKELLGTGPDPITVAEALALGIRGEFGGTWEPSGYSPEELQLARELAGRYRSEDWTWRR